MDANDIVRLIDTAMETEAAAEPPFRRHLGGSMIGRPCERELWYQFRWTKAGSHRGRMLRLFNRGHREEERFVGYLEKIGVKVRAFDENGQQWRILDVDGHFGGSLDGLATNVPMIDPNEEILLEFKTHNTKSFVGLRTDGVRRAKPSHWAQMQVYMYKRQLRLALYMAVNKNDDDLHCEWVLCEPEEGARLIEKAERIIRAPKPPLRISDSPMWFECKFCDFKGPCHMGEPLRKSCRTCVNSEPVADGQWACRLWKAIIPVDVIPVGCDAYKAITD